MQRMLSQRRSFADPFMALVLALGGLMAACSGREADLTQETAPPSALTESQEPATSPRSLFVTIVWDGLQKECAACHVSGAAGAPRLLFTDSLEYSYQRWQQLATEPYEARSLAREVGIDVVAGPGYQPRPGCEGAQGHASYHRPSPSFACALRQWILAEKQAMAAPVEGP